MNSMVSVTTILMVLLCSQFEFSQGESLLSAASPTELKNKYAQLLEEIKKILGLNVMASKIRKLEKHSSGFTVGNAMEYRDWGAGTVRTFNGKTYLARLASHGQVKFDGGPDTTGQSRMQELCGDHDMEIVSINSEAENKFVWNLVSRLGNSNYGAWLGAFKIPGTSKWKWDTNNGTTWEPNTNTIYQNWASGVEFKYGYDCAYIQNEKWYPTQCSNWFQVVCKDPSPTTQIFPGVDGSNFAEMMDFIVKLGNEVLGKVSKMEADIERFRNVFQETDQRLSKHIDNLYESTNGNYADLMNHVDILRALSNKTDVLKQDMKNLLNVTTGMDDINKLKTILRNVGFVINKSRGEIYVAFEIQKKRDEAQQLCKELEMELVSIESLEENKFILQFIKEKFVNQDNIWIGAKKITQEGHSNKGDWQWNDDSNAWGAYLVFQNWLGITVGGSEDEDQLYAVFQHADGKWVTGGEHEQHSFVCEREIKKTE